MYLLKSLALSLLPLAMASPTLLARSCPKPTSFTISSVSIFTQAANQQGFKPTYGSSISFSFSDTTTGVSTTCARSLAPGAGSVADPNNYYSCANTAVTYLWNGSTLYLKEKVTCTSGTETASGSVAGPSDCTPEEPPVPLGYGTECQYPGETSSTTVTVTSES